MITIWTIYERLIPTLGGRPVCGWIASRSARLEPDEVQLEVLGEHVMVSSDIEALRDRLEREGFGQLGRHWRDAPEIVELWLKQHRPSATGAVVSAPFATEKTAKSH